MTFAAAALVIVLVVFAVTFALGAWSATHGPWRK